MTISLDTIIFPKWRPGLEQWQHMGGGPLPSLVTGGCLGKGSAAWQHLEVTAI